MGAIFRGLEMAVHAAERLVSEIGRDFSPGIIDSKSAWASAPGTCPPRVSAGDLGLSLSPSGELLHRASPAQPRHGTLGLPWDFDGTSERITTLEMGLYAKSPMRECVPSPPPFREPPPSHKSHVILYLPATHYESSTYRRVLLLSEAIIQLKTPAPPGGGRGVLPSLYAKLRTARASGWSAA